MTAVHVLTREIGQAERGLRALLETLLADSELSFAEWTALVLVDAAGSLPADELVHRQLASHVAPERTARAAVDRLCSAGLLALSPGSARLALTPAGEATFQPLRRAVSHASHALFADLPQADLEATHRVLDEVARRAEAQLARPPRE